jgi:diguanylate cyclase (GGDEF)-like protein
MTDAEPAPQAITDPLTGAYTRALLAPRLAEELSRASRSTTGFAVLLFDVDYFKSVNDAYGHGRGDEVLQHLCARVNSLIRGYDILFRYGGDEFVLLLPETSETDAVRVALRLVEGIRSVDFAGEPPLSVSVSLGVALFPDDATDTEELLAVADRRNYLAKQRGRACAVADDADNEARPVSSRLLERDVALTTIQDFLTRMRVENRGALRVYGEPGAGHTRFLQAAGQTGKLRGFSVVDAADPYLPDSPAPGGILILADRAAPRVADLLSRVPAHVPLGVVYATVNSADRSPGDVPVLAEIELPPWSAAAVRIWLRTTLGCEPSMVLVDWLIDRSTGLPGRAQRELDRLTSAGGLVRGEHGALTVAPHLLAKPRKRRHQLPVPVTELVGRQRETVQVAHLIAERRLVTLAGPGGIGKTRLALAVGTAVADRFADGAVFVPLAEAAGEDEVVPVLAEALEVAEVPGEALAGTVLAHLADLSMLLVLDNFEHVLRASRFIGQLLNNAPHIRVLICSRERLGVYGEQIYHVPPLTLPDPDVVGTGPSAPARALATSPALALFNTRARAVAYDFAITGENLDTVTELCRRLDGLPLAIELTAAHSDSLSPRQMLAELRHRLDLDGREPRDVPERQRTLQGAVDWSVALLDPASRNLFAWLGVFVGGWQLEALAAVYPDDSGADLGKLLTCLVDKNLVRADPDAAEGLRYSMLETIRRYSVDGLVEIGLAHSAYSRHAAYYTELAERAGAGMTGPQQSAWLERVEREHLNLRVAFSHAMDRLATEQAARIAVGLWRLWRTGRHIGEGREWLARLLDAEDGLSERTDAQVLHAAAVLAGVQDDHEQARVLARRSLAMARAVRDHQTEAQAYNALGIAALAAGDLPTARGHFEESLAISHEHDAPLGMSVAHANLTRLALLRGEVDRARQHAHQCLELDRRFGNTRGIMLGELCLGEIQLASGDEVGAKEHLTEALRIARTLGDVFGEANALHLLGRTVAREGRRAEAMRLVSAAMALRHEVSDRQDLAISLEAMATMLVTPPDDGPEAAGPREEVPPADAELAARLMGAADALRVQHRLPPTGVTATERQGGLTALRGSLNDRTLTAAWTAGQNSPLAMIIDEAVTRAESVPPTR